jgi:hypothetical protein
VKRKKMKKKKQGLTNNYPPGFGPKDIPMQVILQKNTRTPGRNFFN